MKRKNVDLTSLALWILIVIMVVVIILIVCVNIQLQSKSEMKTLAFDLLNSLLSAVTVGLIATTFTKIIADNMAKVKRNNEQLRKFGIDFIGTGRSTRRDTLDLFGNPYTGKYPKEIKLLFITGNGFFRTFQRQLLQCVQDSGCKVMIMLASPEDENMEYLKRMEYICPQKTPYANQVNRESLPILQSVINSLDADKKDRIKVRFYRDEFRYNFRIAKYWAEATNKGYGKCWVNVQTFGKDAVDLSVGLNGNWNSELTTELSSNIFERLDSDFKRLWEKYAETEHEFTTK